MVVGFILVAVYISASGVVEGTALDYYHSHESCYANAVEHEQLSDPGVGFVCIEDYVE